MKARLSNPLPKTQAVKGGIRGGFRIGRAGSSVSRFGRVHFLYYFHTDGFYKIKMKIIK